MINESTPTNRDRFQPRRLVSRAGRAAGKRSLRCGASLGLEPLEARQLLAVITWDGGPGGTGNSWTTAANWVGDVLPGPNDDVVIGAGATDIFLATGSLTPTSVRSVDIRRALTIQSSTTLAISQTASFTAQLTVFDQSALAVGSTATFAGLALSTSSFQSVPAISLGSNAIFTGNVSVFVGQMSVSGTATFSGNVSVNSGQISVGGTASMQSSVTLSSGTLRFSQAATIAGPLSGSGTLDRSSDLTLFGTTTWVSGTMSGSGRTVIPASATFQMTASSLNVSGTFENFGTVAVTDSSFSFGDTLTPGTILNRAGGLMRFQPTSFASLSNNNNNPSNSFTNEGRIEKLGSGTLTFTTTAFSNTGTSRVFQGLWQIQSSAGPTGQTSGSIQVDSLGRFSAQNHTFAAGSVVSGSGLVSLELTTVVNGTISATGEVAFTDTTSGFDPSEINGTISGATLLRIARPVIFNAPQTFAGEVRITSNVSGPGDLTLSGIANWSGGTMSGTGRTIVSPVGRFSVTGGTLARTLDNRGTLDLSGPSGTLFFGTNLTPGILLNGASAVLNIPASMNISQNILNSANRLTNAGVINKSGTGQTGISGIRFDNTGTINILQGAFRTETTFVIGGTSSGTFNIDPSAEMLLGNHTLTAGARIIGGGTARFTGNVTVSGALTNESLLRLEGTTTINANITLDGSFELTGTLAGSGTVTLTGQNSFWNPGGVMQGTGRTILASGASMFVNGSTGSPVLGRAFENRGTLNFNGTGSMALGRAGLPGVLENTTSGIVNFPTSMGLAQSETNIGNTFRNAGVVNKDGLQDVFLSSVNFENSGTVNSRGGTLWIESAGAQLVNTSTGIFDAATGGAINLSNQSLATGAVLRGFGSITFTGTNNSITGVVTSTVARLDISGTLTVDANVTFAGPVRLVTSRFGGLAVLAGSGDVTFANSLEWNAGRMIGSGRTLIAPGGRADFTHASGVAPVLARTFENQGTINASGTGAISFGESIDPGVFVNRSGGSITFTSGMSFFQNVANADNAFTNQGLITKIGNGTSSFSVESFNNLGSINVVQGSLSFNGGTSSGSFEVAAGATLNISSGTNTVSLLTGTQFRGLGRVNLSSTIQFSGSINNSATLDLTSASLTLASSSTLGGRVTFGSAFISGSGNLTLTGQASWSTSFGTWSGAGRVIIASGATLTLEPHPSGSFFRLARTLENFGTITFNAFNGQGLGLGSGSLPGAIINRSTGVFRIVGSQGGSIFAAVANPLNAFVNEGRIEKTNASTFSLSGVAFSNTGTVYVEQRDLSIDTVNALVGGNFDIRANASVSLPQGMSLGANQSLLMAPEARLTITGGLATNTTNPDLFRPSGDVQLGSGSTTLEAASVNRGATAAGFDRNFAFGRLTIRSGTVRLVDTVRNTGPAAEAVYANSVLVSSSTILDLNGLQLFTRAAQIDGTVRNGTITIVPDGGPLPITAPSQGNIASIAQVDEWSISARAGNTLNVFVNPGALGITAPVGGSPLMRARIEVVAPNGTVIATRSNAALASGSQIDLSRIVVPTTGTYRIRVSAPTEFASSTGRYSLWYYEGFLKQNDAFVNTRVVGSIDAAYGTDRLSFAEVAGTDIRLDVITGSSPRVKFALTGPNGESVFSDLSSTSPIYRLPTTGRYTLTVQADSDKTGSYAFTIQRNALGALPLNGSIQGTIAGSGGSMLYKVDVAIPKPLRVTLDDFNNDNRNEVYVRYGSAPTRADYDFRYLNEASADQLVSIPRAQAGSWYVLVYTTSAAAPSTYSLSSAASEVFVTGASPDRNSASRPLAMTLDGAGFKNGTVVEIIGPAGQVTLASDISVVSPTRMMATFTTTGLPIGRYSVRVRDVGGDTSQLTSFLSLTTGVTPRLETRLTLPATMNSRSNGTILIEYANTGDASMPAPILQLQSGDPDNSDRPRLALDQSLAVRGVWTSARADGFANFVQVLASGATPGVLNPGERITVSVFYAGGDGVDDGAVEMELRSYESTDTTPIAWPSLRDSLRPPSFTDEAWTPIFNNLTTTVGPTWGGFVSAISSNAQFLGMVNRNVTDVRELFAYQVQQAIGFSPIPTLASSTDAGMNAPGISLDFSRSYSSLLPSRFAQGPFGRGWSTSWSTRLQFDADGSVNVTTGGPSQRRFQPDSRSRNNPFFSAPGDTSRLFRRGAVWDLLEIDGGFTRFTNTGLIDFIQDRFGNRVTVGYSGTRVTTVTHSSGQRLNIAYNPAGLIQSVSDTVGRSTTFAYDPSNQYLLSATSFDGQVTSYTYDQTSTDGRRHALTSITRAGVTEFYQYDTSGRLSRRSLAGNVEPQTYTYSVGRVTTTDAAGGSTRVDFDSRGQAARVIDPLNRTTLMNYTPEGRLSLIIDPLGQRRSFTWTTNGQPASITDELGNTTRFDYGTAFSLLTRFTDAAGNATQYIYDNRGSLLSTVYPNGSADFQSSNALGQVTSYTNRRGQVITFAYNPAGQLTEQRATDGTYSLFTYDARGNMLTAVNAATTLTYVYDPRTDRLTSVTYADGRALNYTYDQFLRRQTMADETGWTLRYTYNPQGRLQSVQDGAGVPIISYGYDPVGRLASEIKRNGTTTGYTYDLAGQMLEIANRTPSGAINTRFAYTYDQLGRPITQATVDGSWTYGYDAIGQLTLAQFASINPLLSNQDLRYAYDSIGNWTTVVRDGVTSTYTSNNLGQYTRINGDLLTYDSDGNLLGWNDAGQSRTLKFNAFGQLTSSEVANRRVRLDRDPIGRLFRRSINNEAASLVFDPVSGLLVSSQTDIDRTRVLSTFGVSGFFRESEWQFLESDSVGSVAAVINSVGSTSIRAASNPFGDRMSDSSLSMIGLATFNGVVGGLAVDNGLLAQGARAYSTSLGRFVSSDPLGPAAGLQSLYAFAGNSPVRYVDPSGFTRLLGIRSRDVYVLKFNKEQINNAPESVYDVSPDAVLQEFLAFGFRLDDGSSLDLASDIPSNLIALNGGLNAIPSLEYAPGFAGVEAGGRLAVEAGTNLVAVLTQGLQISNIQRALDLRGQDDVRAMAIVLQRDLGLVLTSDGRIIRATAVSPNQINTGGSDPNDIIGPAGFGPQNFIRPDQDLPYRIRFENFGPGSVDTNGNPTPVFTTGPAQRVEVVQRIDDRFDLSTFRFTGFGFGDVRIVLDPPSQSYRSTRSFTFNDRTFDVVLEAYIDTFARELVVTLNAVDPLTQLPPELITGFLPPEDGTGRGQGFITYTIRPLAGLPTGTQIRSIANIVFDGNPPIPTNQIDPLDPSQGTSPDREAPITLDGDKPISRVTAFAGRLYAKWLNVRWSGTDVGAGIQSYDIYLSANDGPYTLWRSRTTLTSDWLRVVPGGRYAFYSVARDNVGNTEEAPAAPDAVANISTRTDIVSLGPVDPREIPNSTSATFSAELSPALPLGLGGILAPAPISGQPALPMPIQFDRSSTFIFIPRFMASDSNRSKVRVSNRPVVSAVASFVAVKTPPARAAWPLVEAPAEWSLSTDLKLPTLDLPATSSQ